MRKEISGQGRSHALTAIDDDNTPKEAMDMGCIAYLQKPFSSHLLLNAISKATT